MSRTQPPPRPFPLFIKKEKEKKSTDSFDGERRHGAQRVDLVLGGAVVAVGGADSAARCSVVVGGIGGVVSSLGSSVPGNAGAKSTATASCSTTAMTALLHLAGYGGSAPSSRLWRRHGELSTLWFIARIYSPVFLLPSPLNPEF